MNEFQQVMLALSELNQNERDLLAFVIKKAKPLNNFEVLVQVSDKVFSNSNNSPIYMLNSAGQSLFNKVLCFKMHQEQRNSLSFRCFRSFKRVDGETYAFGLSSVILTVLSDLKRFMELDVLDQLSVLKRPMAKYFFLVHKDSLSMSLEDFRTMLMFSETNKDKRNWMHRHVNPAFEELKEHYMSLYRINYRRDKRKIIGVDLIIS